MMVVWSYDRTFFDEHRWGFFQKKNYNNDFNHDVLVHENIIS